MTAKKNEGYDYRTAREAQAAVAANLAEYVEAGVISQEVAEAMLESGRQTAEPCPTCHVGRGRWCIDAHGSTAALHADRTAAAR